MATFRCKDCGERVRNVEQQFVLTYPMMCTGIACGNKRNWTLVKEESKFVDWQRAKVQENSDEVRRSTHIVAYAATLLGSTCPIGWQPRLVMLTVSLASESAASARKQPAHR